MRMFGSCVNSCAPNRKSIEICTMPSIERLRKLHETDIYTMDELSALDEGTIFDIDYIIEGWDDADG